MNKLKLAKEPLYSRKVANKICVVSQCTRGTTKHYKLCFKHKREKQKIENPLRYWFDILRQNAKRREIDFGLTIEEFKLFCDRTNYLEKKGQDAGSYTIDRIKNSIGYYLDNLQVLTLSQNSRKRFIDLKIRFGRYPTEEELAEFIEASRLPENPEPQIETREETEPEDEDIIPF